MNLNVHITVRSLKRNPHSIMLDIYKLNENTWFIKTHIQFQRVQSSFVRAFTKPASFTASSVPRGATVWHSPVKGLLLRHPLGRTSNSQTTHPCNMQTFHLPQATEHCPESTYLGPRMFPKADASTFNWNYQYVTTLMKSYTKPNYSTGKFILGLHQVIWQWLFRKEPSLKGAMQFH